MFRSIENSPRYHSFVELIEDVKRRYHRTHPEETEGPTGSVPLRGTGVLGISR
jgi:hypothetical protein